MTQYLFFQSLQTAMITFLSYSYISSLYIISWSNTQNIFRILHRSLSADSTLKITGVFQSTCGLFYGCICIQSTKLHLCLLYSKLLAGATTVRLLTTFGSGCAQASTSDKLRETCIVSLCTVPVTSSVFSLCYYFQFIKTPHACLLPK